MENELSATPSAWLRVGKLTEFQACVKEFIITDSAYKQYMEAVKMMVGDLVSIEQDFRIAITSDYIT